MFHWTSATPLSASQFPNFVGPTHTHHFPSLISGTYFDCYYHVDDDALCDKGVCGPSSFSMQLITQKQANCHYWLLGSIIISYFSNPSTWRAPKLWQWGAPHWLVGTHEIFSGYTPCPMVHGSTPILLMSPPLLVVLVAWIEWEMLVHR